MEEPKAVLDIDMRLQLPNHFLFVGASQSGKTRLALRLLADPLLFHPRPAKVIFWFDMFQPIYQQTKTTLQKLGIEMVMHRGFNETFKLEDVEHSTEQTILFIDDFSDVAAKSGEIARIATNGRHKNLSLFLIQHQLYYKYPESRTIALNSRYYFLLPSIRLEAQLRTLGSQLNVKSDIITAFKQCTEMDYEKYRYLLLDMGAYTIPLLRLRSRVHKFDWQICFG